MKLTKEQLWKLVEDANWKKDHNYERIKSEFQKLPEDEFKQLENFCRNLQESLMNLFHEKWLYDPGIDVSDDGWNDLTAEVVGRGKSFYNSITVKKLQEMADTNNYNENFMYSFLN